MSLLARSSSIVGALGAARDRVTAVKTQLSVPTPATIPAALAPAPAAPMPVLLADVAPPRDYDTRPTLGEPTTAAPRKPVLVEEYAPVAAPPIRTAPVLPTFPAPAPLTVAPAAPTPVLLAKAPVVTAPTPPPTETNNVSLLGKIGGVLTGVAKVAGGFAAGGPVGAALAGATLIKRPAAATPLTQSGLPALAGGLGGLVGKLGGAVGTAVGRVGVPGLIGTAVGTALSPSSGCGCNGSSGRDPCTGQKLSSQKAPDATFFGGCCPPGRVLRRQPWARDICIKKPKMNPFNPAALARADRRITQFSRRSTAILRGMGFSVTRTRKVAGVKTGGPRRRGRRAS